MIVAIIPARGGSKRIPRKNIKNFNGKPMLAWSIEAAIASKLFDKIIVSTDDTEISEVAINYGAEVPFKRPLSLSNDYTATSPVISHAIKFLDNSSAEKCSFVCCIYPTAPFIDSKDIISGFKFISNPNNNWNFVFSAAESLYPVYRAFTNSSNGGVSMLFPEYFSHRSQDLPKVMHDAGQFYWGTSKAWLKNEVIFTNNSKPILIPNHRVQDIDTVDDWKRAESLLCKIKEKTI